MQDKSITAQTVHLALCANPELLRTYCRHKGRVPTKETIREDVLIHLRRTHAHLPEHMLLPWVESAYKGQNRNQGHLLYQALGSLAREHLFWKDGRAWVHSEHLLGWQDLIPHTTPLVLIAALAEDVHQRTDRRETGIRGQLQWAVSRSTLPTCIDPAFEALVGGDGVHDVHVHISGVPEADLVWQAALFDPLFVHRKIAEKWDSPQARQLFRSQGIEKPFELLRMLRLARWLRLRLHQAVKGLASERRQVDLEGQELSERRLARDVGRLLVTGQEPTYNRYFSIFGLRDRDKAQLPFYLLQDEAMLWFDLLPWLRHGGRLLGYLAHFYLLLRCWLNVFLGQGRTSVGFSSFAEIAGSPLRETVEKNYGLVFQQLQVHTGPAIQKVDLRFAPEPSCPENMQRVHALSWAWQGLQSASRKRAHGKKAQGSAGGDWESSTGDLKLTAHFIKSKDQPKQSNTFCRCQKQRTENYITAKALLQAREKSRRVRDSLYRVDAAVNEMDTPPEAFASLFRLLRSRGLSRFTYHVGEDYPHLLSGLRAVDEALSFLDLGAGDRLGHATALGMDPETWAHTAGAGVVCKKGEWLWNMIWLHGRIQEDPEFAHLSVKIRE